MDREIQLARRAAMTDPEAAPFTREMAERADTRRIVRKFSTCGPCIPLGRIVRETPIFYVYAKKQCLGAPDITMRVKKDEEQLIHSTPCVSCKDHPRTQHPNGYEG